MALIEPKLCINHWKVLYKLCVFYVDRNSKMTTTAGHSFFIGLIGSFYNQVNDTGSSGSLFSILAVSMATAAILKKSTPKGTTSHGI
jgi:predicted small integral membrane protein